MTLFPVLVLGAAAGGLALRYALTAPPSDVARMLRTVGAALLGLFGFALTLTGRGMLGLPAIAGAYALWRKRGRASSSSGAAASEVTTDWLTMRLDHASGAMSGRVNRGRSEGTELDALSLGDLFDLLREIEAGGDSQSVRLLEAYLDRRSPGWSDRGDGGEGAGLGGTPGSGTMSQQEAYEILGLAPGAGEAEIREAHRRLMKGAHPDAGGSSESAARLNEAKDVLLAAHR